MEKEKFPVPAVAQELQPAIGTGVLLTQEQLGTPGGYFLSTFVEFLTSLQSNGKFAKWNIFAERGLPTEESKTMFHHFFDTIKGQPAWGEGQSLVSGIFAAHAAGIENIFSTRITNHPEWGETFQLIFETESNGRRMKWTFQVSADGKHEMITGYGVPGQISVPPQMIGEDKK